MGSLTIICSRPGLHTSKNTPANYVPRGVRRFFQELGSLPSSVTTQVAESLRRYIADVDDKYLVIGGNLNLSIC